MIDFKAIKEAVQNVTSFEALEALRATLMGKKGEISLALKQLGQLSGEERREKGRELNVLKENIQQIFSQKRKTLETLQWESALAKEKIDTTLSAPHVWEGCFHPINQVIAEIIDIFVITYLSIIFISPEFQ